MAVYRKELAHGRNLGNPKSAWCVHKPERREPVLQFKSKTSWREVKFGLLRFSIDWMRPIHIMKHNLLYSKSTDLNAAIVFGKRKHPSQKFSGWYLTKYLSTASQSNLYIKLTSPKGWDKKGELTWILYLFIVFCAHKVWGIFYFFLEGVLHKWMKTEWMFEFSYLDAYNLVSGYLHPGQNVLT